MRMERKKIRRWSVILLALFEPGLALVILLATICVAAAVDNGLSALEFLLGGLAALLAWVEQGNGGVPVAHKLAATALLALLNEIQHDLHVVLAGGQHVVAQAALAAAHHLVRRQLHIVHVIDERRIVRIGHRRVRIDIVHVLVRIINHMRHGRRRAGTLKRTVRGRRR
ncbi:hypothetical protein BC940DRAFT_294037 [Gongronella butleri]|nr:hypothetical protein BC940DRAFT_294037 [Gongronella butleri]